eukprot:GHVQ01039506.1.p1 GENE.GHVQ01039506.1~~GHVQ01039506.1.p1  ORF type:complete len:428 (-),score=55.07 GHVQ01039506.1:1147-2430(-)
MTDKDRVSIHEAMEQQSISISKAGIVTELKARCSVIAAANPKFGRYEPSLTFKENVDLSDPILSRFDLIAVLRDIPNFDNDYSLADYVVSNHIMLHPHIGDKEGAKEQMAELEKTMRGHMTYELIPQNILQKYILYARKKCRPTLGRLQTQAHERIAAFYWQVRRRAAKSGGFPMTLRHLDSMVRISEANAKMRLASFVNVKDADMAIATMLESYISSQKHSVAASLGREFARYIAIARGGFEMLGEIVRRNMQDLLNKHRVFSVDYISDDSLYHDVNDTDKLLSVEYFRQFAKLQKFSDLNIDAWIRSKDFTKQFRITRHDDKDYIESLNFARPTGTTRPTRDSTFIPSSAAESQSRRDSVFMNSAGAGSNSDAASAFEDSYAQDTEMGDDTQGGKKVDQRLATAAARRRATTHRGATDGGNGTQE